MGKKTAKGWAVLNDLSHQDLGYLGIYRKLERIQKKVKKAFSCSYKEHEKLVCEGFEWSDIYLGSG